MQKHTHIVVSLSNILRVFLHLSTGWEQLVMRREQLGEVAREGPLVDEWGIGVDAELKCFQLSCGDNVINIY